MVDRGYSVTGMWNEHYKRISNETSIVKAWLRKGLKKSQNSNDNNVVDSKSLC